MVEAQNLRVSFAAIAGGVALTLACFFACVGAFVAQGCGGSDDDPGSDRVSGIGDASSGAPDAGDTGPSGDTGSGGRDAAIDAGPIDSGDGPRSIIFLHTNDEHSHHLGFAPEIDDYPSPASSGSGIVGGLKRRAKVLQDLRQAALLDPYRSPVALVSAGDQMIGTLFHLANPVSGIDYAVATTLQYDVMTLGDREFDLGPRALAGALASGGISVTGQPGIVGVPIVTTNIRFSMERTGDDALATYYSVAGGPVTPLRRTYLRNFGNVRVGFIGLMGLEAASRAFSKAPLRFSLATTATRSCTRNLDCGSDGECVPSSINPKATTGSCVVSHDETDFETHLSALISDAAFAVSDLRAQGADLIVALTHAGLDEREIDLLRLTGMWGSARRSEDVRIALGVDDALASIAVKGIDVIIGGHSHIALDEPLSIPNPASGITTFVAQAGENGEWVGKLRLTQSSRSAPWTLDSEYSALSRIDDTVSITGLAQLTELTIETLIDLVMNGLETQPIARAGDGGIFPGEQCDGAALPNDGNCAGLVPGATRGALSCLSNRQIDTGGCGFARTSTCGDSAADLVDLTEQCDVTDLRGATCASLGYESGALACDGNCTFDRSGCTPYFPSLLEAVVNFPDFGATIRNQPGQVGDLFFYRVGTTTFDVGESSPSNESNLLNLTADAERWSVNALIPSFSDDPIRVFVQTNGLIGDGVFGGMTGELSLSDLFRVLPGGFSPVEQTPTFPAVDFYWAPEELRAALEVGVNQGLTADALWMGFSGLRVEYDPSLTAFDPGNPAATGQITKMTVVETSTIPWNDQTLESSPIFDASLGAGSYPDPTRLIHMGMSFHSGLTFEALGLCPRDVSGTQYPACRRCAVQADCPLAGTTCDVGRGRCVGSNPAVFSARSLIPGTNQEIKEFLALVHYVRSLPGAALPPAYQARTPRRSCCVGASCPADDSRSCQ